MVSSLKLANLWRVISDIDLDRIRATADTPVELLVVAEDPDLGERVRVGLGAVDQGGVHPAVLVASPEQARARSSAPLVTVLVSRHADLSVAMKGVDEHCIRHGWPRLTLVVGSAAPASAARRVAEQARVAIEEVVPAPRPLLTTIVDLVDGDLRIALASTLPVFRPLVAQVLVDDTARANASFAVTTGLAETIPVLTAPLNMGDMIVLTKNQLIMGYKIALAAGRRAEPRAMVAELLGVIGGGLLFRQAARQLVGLIPVAGLVPKVAIAYAGTYAIGRALTAWAMSGVEVTPETLATYTSEGLGRGREMAQQMLAQVKGGVPSPRRSWQRLRGWLPSRKSGRALPPADV